MTFGQDIAAVILAGGQATRMGGGDKCLLRLGDRLVLDLILDNLRPQVAEIALNANGDPARFAPWALPVVADTFAGHPGPLAGLLAGMTWAASEGRRWVLTVAGDTPFFPANLAGRLGAAIAEADADIALAGTSQRGRFFRHPTFGLWSVALRDDLSDALASGTRKIVSWADRHPNTSVSFDDMVQGDFDPFFNINAPEDLREASTFLERCS